MKVEVVPSWGSHPDDPVVACEPAYFGDPDLAEGANFVIHRQSDGRTVVTGGPDPSGNSALVAVLGAGNRVLADEERVALEDLLAELEGEPDFGGGLSLVAPVAPVAPDSDMSSDAADAPDTSNDGATGATSATGDSAEADEADADNPEG